MMRITLHSRTDSKEVRLIIHTKVSRITLLRIPNHKGSENSNCKQKILRQFYAKNYQFSQNKRSKCSTQNF